MLSRSAIVLTLVSGAVLIAGLASCKPVDLAQSGPTVGLGSLVSGEELRVADQLDGTLKELLAASLQGKAARPSEYRIGGKIAYGEVFQTAQDSNPIVDIYVVGDLKSAEVALRAIPGVSVLGVASTASYGVVSASLPPSRFLEAARVSGVKGIQASQMEVGGGDGLAAKAGLWQNEAVRALFVDRLQAYFPQADGRGIRIGVLSDSVNQRDSFPGDGRVGIAESQNTSDLPGDALITVVSDAPGGADEGRAMMEHIYDIAPGAAMYGFASAFIGGDAGFASNITSLSTTAGMHIICDDVGSAGEPFYEDGVIATAVNNHTDRGLYFALAGNSGNASYEAVWNDSSGNGVHEYNGDGREVQRATLPAGMGFGLTLQWSQRFGQATTDLNLEVRNSTGETVLATSNTNNLATGNPWDRVTFTNTTNAPMVVHLLVTRVAGDATGLTFKYAPNVNNALTLTEYSANAKGVIVPHAGTLRSIAVGASPQFDTSRIEGFSSRGPHRRFFGPLGADEQTFQKPDFVGVDGCTTSFFPSGAGAAFFGTSAATPNVAAVAALCLQLAGGPGSLSQAEMRQLLRITAEERGDPFHDTTWGFGLVNALGAGLVAAGPQPVTDWVIPNQRGDVSETIEIDNDRDLSVVRYPCAGGLDTVFSTIDFGNAYYRPVQLHFAEDGSDSLQVIAYDSPDGRSVANFLAGNNRPTYRVEVATKGGNFGRTPYNLVLDGPPFPVQPYTPDEFGIVRGFVNQAAPVVYYEVPIPDDAGLTVTIECSSQDVDVALAAFEGFSGDQIGFVDDAGGGETLVIPTPGYDTGFYLAVTSKRFESFGNFDLRVSYDTIENLPRSTEFSVVNTQYHSNPVTGVYDMFGELPEGGGFHVFAFDPRGSRIAASVPGTVPVGTLMSLGIYDENQTRGPAVGDVVLPAVESTTKPGPSYYMYAATGAGAPAMIYGLTVALAPPPAPNGTLVLAPQVVDNIFTGSTTGQLADLGEEPFYLLRVPASATGSAAIHVSPQPGSESLDLAFRVLDEGGLTVGGIVDENPDGWPEQATLSLTPGALYHIQIFGKPKMDSYIGDGTQYGQFEMGVTLETGTIDAAEPNDSLGEAFDAMGFAGSWSDETLGQFTLNDADYFRFDLTDGQNSLAIRVRAIPPAKGITPAPPSFRLLDFEGNLVAESYDEDGQQALILEGSLTLGRYYLEVQGPNPDLLYSLLWVPYTVVVPREEQWILN